MWKRRLLFLVLLYGIDIRVNGSGSVDSNSGAYIIDDVSSLSSFDGSKEGSISECEEELREVRITTVNDNVLTPKGLRRESSLESYGSIESDPFGGIDADAFKLGGGFRVDRTEEEASSKHSSPVSPVLPDYAIRIGTLDDHIATEQNKIDFQVQLHQRTLNRSPTSLRSSGSSRKSLNLHVSFGNDQIFILKEEEEILITEADRSSLEFYLFLAAREGDLRSFESVSAALKQLNEKVFNNRKGYLRDPKRDQKGLLSAAIQGKSLEIFLKAMAFEGIAFKDLNPCRFLHQSPSSDDLNQIHATSYPPKNRSLLDDYDSDSDPEIEGHCESIEETTLGEIIECNATKILNHLLTVGGIKDEYPAGHRSALHYAVEKDQLDCVRMLLEFGGSQVNTIDSQHQTPLFKIFTESLMPRNGFNIAELLLQNGANINETDIKMRNIVHYISERGSLATLKFIHENYLSKDKFKSFDLYLFVNAQENITKNTVLHLAKDREIFNYLVQVMGADQTKKNAFGKNGLEYFNEAHSASGVRSRTNSRDLHHRYY